MREEGTLRPVWPSSASCGILHDRPTGPAPGVAVSSGPSHAAAPAAAGARCGSGDLHADWAHDVPHPRKWLRGKRIGVRIARKGIESGEHSGRRRWAIERTIYRCPATTGSTTAANAVPAATRSSSARPPPWSAPSD